MSLDRDDQSAWYLLGSNGNSPGIATGDWPMFRLHTMVSTALTAVALMAPMIGTAGEAARGAQQGSPPIAPASTHPQLPQAPAACQFSWLSVVGAVLGSATDQAAGRVDSKTRVDGLGKASGDAVQGIFAPGCVK